MKLRKFSAFAVILLCLSIRVSSFAELEDEFSLEFPDVEYESRKEATKTYVRSPTIQKYDYLNDTEQSSREGFMGPDTETPTPPGGARGLKKKKKHPSNATEGLVSLESRESKPETCHCPCLNKRKSSSKQREERRQNQDSLEAEPEADRFRREGNRKVTGRRMFRTRG